MGRPIRTTAWTAALAAACLPAALQAEDAAVLPCLSQAGFAQAFRATFAADGRAEPSVPADRPLAAQAIGAMQFLMTRMPRPDEPAEDHDETPRRMHSGNERNADLLFSRRGDAFSLVAPAGVVSGTATVARCIMAGPALAGVRAALDATVAEARARPIAIRSQEIPAPEPGLNHNLRIFVLEHLFEFTPTEPMYGPLGIVVTYRVARQ